MHGLAIIGELAAVFAFAAVVTGLLRLVRVPSLVGYLVTGILVGPSVLALVPDPGSVRTVAEIGVVLLLFAIGLEFSLGRLWAMRRDALVGGALQVLACGAAGFGVARLASVPVGPSVIAGFVVALSSTAIVARALSDAGEVDAPHGRLAIGLLLFQDLAVVPMTLLVPLVGGERLSAGGIVLPLLEAAGVVAVVAVLARRLVPWILDKVTALRSRELFLVVLTALFLGTGWLTTLAGMSMALGAFLAGVVISESEHRIAALAEAVPFRDVFNALFFVSVGMLLDLRALAANPLPALLVTAGILVGKSLLVAAVAMVLGHPVRIATRTGLALGQIGEFSFVLLLVAAPVVPAGLYQTLLAATVLTMLATPASLALAPWLGGVLERSPLGRLAGRRTRPGGTEPTVLEHHVIIVGYGLNGRRVAGAARAAEIPFVVIEENPQTVRAERMKGTPILLGDASRPEVLDHAGIARAETLVLAIADREACRRAVTFAKRLAPQVHVVVRARYAQDVEPLGRLGASEVVPEELMSAVEITKRVLSHHGVAPEVADTLAARERI